MRLALGLGYAAASSPRAPGEALALVRAAERLGFDSAWASEAYGADAVTVLAWLAGQTERIGLGSAVMQVPARTAATTAMTAATLDALSGGRFRLGLGVSGPQVSEGWHGVRFDAPLARTREYVEVVRLALARRPLEHAGEHLRLPLPGGAGVPLRLALPAPRPDLPIYLAATGPRNTELAGEVADGWLPVFLVPEQAGEAMAAVARGRARCALPGGAQRPFDVAAGVPVLLTEDGADLDDPAVAAPLRAHAALYLGGMGSRARNFYKDAAERAGHGAAAARVQDLYLAGHRREAAAAVPAAYLQATCLLGPPAALAGRVAAHAAAGTTTLVLQPLAAGLEERVAALEAVAAVVRAEGPGVTASPSA